MKVENIILNSFPENYDQDKPIMLKVIETEHGRTLDEVAEEKVSVDGTIDAATNYIMKKYADKVSGKTIQPNGVITYSVDPKKLFIKFDEYPEHPIKGACIVGKMEQNPELLEWGINTGKKFYASNLIKLIRSQAHNFVTNADAAGLIKLLQNFEAVFTTERKSCDDRKGNKEEAIKDAIKVKQGDLPANLQLLISIFKGGDQRPVAMEIELDREGSEVVYSFYSLNLQREIIETAKEEIGKHVDLLKDTFVCIQQA